MQVEKVLNNNVIISKDETGSEVVVMGKGIGFQMKQGMTIAQDNVEKVFRLSQTNDDTVDSRYRELLEEIPLELLVATESIVELAEKSLPGTLHPSVRISLADHLYFAIERYSKGMAVKNAMLWELKRLYPKEFQVGKQALSLLKEASGVSFEEDEAGFIALHLVNAQLNEDMNNTISVTNLIRDIIHMIKYNLHLDFDEESVEFQRLVTHLKFFSHRLIHNTTVTDPDDSLFQSIRAQYPNAFGCTQKIAAYIKREFDHDMTSEEMMFLTIHIERVRRAGKSE